MRGLARLLFLLIVLAGIAPAISSADVEVDTLKLTPLANDRHLAIEIKASSSSREAAMSAARNQAVLDSVARIYLTEQLTLAEDLLLKYLDNYGARFVDGVDVLSENYSGGKHNLTLKVFVNYNNLVTDLGEKRFLYRPAPRPRFVSFMTETLDGTRNNDGVGRAALSSAVNALGLRRNRTELPAPAQTTDLLSDSEAFARARAEAQRAGVEVLVTGTAETTFVEERKVYLEQFYFFRATMDVQLVRVDSGEVLFSARSVATAGQASREGGIRLALERAANDAANELLATFGEYWPVVVQNEADYHVMVSGADDAQVQLVIQGLQARHPELRAYTRKRFGTTTVLSVVFDGSSAELVAALQSGSYPSVALVRQPAGKMVEIQVIG